MGAGIYLLMILQLSSSHLLGLYMCTKSLVYTLTQYSQSFQHHLLPNPVCSEYPTSSLCDWNPMPSGSSHSSLSCALSTFTVTVKPNICRHLRNPYSVCDHVHCVNRQWGRYTCEPRHWKIRMLELLKRSQVNFVGSPLYIYMNTWFPVPIRLSYSITYIS